MQTADLRELDALTMGAGLQLDLAIAHHVMGWQPWEENYQGNAPPYTVNFNHKAIEMMVRSHLGWDSGGFYRFSHDVAAAIQVRHHVPQFVLINHSDGAFEKFLCLTRLCEEWPSIHNQANCYCVVAEASSAALAICRAALLWRQRDVANQ